MPEPLRHAVELLLRRARPAATDRELLSAFASSRDEAAFAELVRRHGPLVRGACRRALGDVPDADDAFQATFLLLARRAGHGGWGATVGPWLYQAARRVAANARTAAHRRRRAEARTPPRDFAADPATAASLADLRRALDDELGRLPARLRDPLVLCYLGGRTRDEAAAQLGVSLATVRRRLDRGREVLRARLERRGVTLALAGLAALADARALPAKLAAAAVSCATGPTVPPAVAALLSPPLSGFQLSALFTLLAVAGFGATLCGGRVTSAAPIPAVPRDWHGEPLPAGAVARLGSTALRPADLACYAVAPDGRTVVIGESRQIGVWDLQTGRMLGPPLTTEHPASSLAVTPDGRSLVTSVSRVSPPRTVVNTWDLATRTLTRTVQRPYGVADQFQLNKLWHYAAVVPGGAAHAGLDPAGTIHLADPATGAVTHSLAAGGRVAQLAYGGDGRYVVTTHDGGVLRVWEVATGRQVGRVDRPPGDLALVALSADGRLVAAVPPTRLNLFVKGLIAGGTVEVWDAAKNAKLREVAATTETLSAVAFGPGDVLYAAGYGPHFALARWDIATGQCDWSNGDLAEEPHARLYASPDGKFVYGFAGGRLRRWDAASGRDPAAAEGYARAVQRVEFDDGDRVAVTYGDDGWLRRWDAATGRPLGAEVLWSPGRRPTVVAPGGKRFVTSTWDGGRLVTRLVTREGRTLADWQGFLNPPAFTPDGRRLAVEEAGGVRVCVRDAESGRELRSIEGQGIVAALLTPDGRRVVSSDLRHVRVTDVADGETVAEWKLIDLRLPAVAGGQPQSLPAFGNGQFMNVNLGAIAPDGAALALAAGTHVVLCDLMTGAVKRAIARPVGPGVLAFAPDGRTLAAAEKSAVRVWDVATGAELAAFEGQGGLVTSLTFSPDGRRLAATAQDATTLIWNVGGARPGR